MSAHGEDKDGGQRRHEDEDDDWFDLPDISLRLNLSPRRERLFLSSVVFVLTFGVTRAVTHALHLAGAGPGGGLTVNGVHVHHLVFGIVLLLLIGYLWLLQVGTGHVEDRRLMSRLTACTFGLAAALTLDEFALWLHLEDVYWQNEGRVSVDAIIVFGAVLWAWLWGAPLLRLMGIRVSRQARRATRRATRRARRVLSTRRPARTRPG